MHNNYIYGIFNQNSIQEQLRQQQLQQHHNNRKIPYNHSRHALFLYSDAIKGV